MVGWAGDRRGEGVDVRRILAIAVTTVFVAAACGGDDGGQAQSGEGAAEAVTSANEALLRGDVGGVLNFLSEECRGVVDEGEVRLAVSLIPAFFSEFFDDFGLDDIDVSASVVSFDDDTARVEVSFVGPDDAQIDELGFSAETVDVVYENGKWVDSGCEFEDTTQRDADLLADALEELGYDGTVDDPIPAVGWCAGGRGIRGLGRRPEPGRVRRTVHDQ